MPMFVTNVQSFCAAHRLHNPDFPDDWNKEMFGKCNHINSHGHNYKIEVTVTGKMDQTRGFFMNMRQLKVYLCDIIEPLDHKRLDVDIAYFADNKIIASAENLAIYIWDELEKVLPPEVHMYNIRVHETDKNYVDYTGPN